MLKPICDLINAAVAMIASGHTADALRVFEEAHRALRAAASLEEDTVSTEQLPFNVVPVAAPQRRYDIGYSKVFAVSGGLTENDRTTCSVVVKYNMAVSIQLEEGPGCQRKAGRLYKQCLQTMRPLVQVDESVLCLARLTVACLHNTSLLLFDAGAYDQATATIRWMQQVLSTRLPAQANNQSLFDAETMQELSLSGQLIPFCRSLIKSTPAA